MTSVPALRPTPASPGIRENDLPLAVGFLAPLQPNDGILCKSKR
jgi:hypothetical protein